jgi:uncharacterized protein (TIGR00297 family)
LNPELLRAGTGAILAIVVSAIALRRRTLTQDGAVAASVTGMICAAAGWSWVAILLAFFTTSTLLSRFREKSKAEMTRGIIEKGSERDAVQVFANGGAFTLAAAGSFVAPSDAWHLIGAGAIAASAADTWATEIGTLFSGSPRSILTWRKVSPGTSGGISAAGTAAAVAGAAFIAAVATLTGWPLRAACAALAGGISGCLLDSVLGASLQAKRWCDACGRETERNVHDCGATTRHAGGIGWMNNDMVNALSSIGGASIGALCLL